MALSAPRDYHLFGFTYDSKVVSALSWWLIHQEAEPLVAGFDDEMDALVAAEKKSLVHIIEARAEEIHQPVWWTGIERIVCICGLVVRSLDRFADPIGHLDPRTWTPAATVVVKLEDTESRYLAACQDCGAGRRTDDLDQARSWAHECAPLEPDDGAELRPQQPAADEHFDDLVHRLRAARRAHRRGPDGP